MKKKKTISRGKSGALKKRKALGSGKKTTRSTVGMTPLSDRVLVKPIPQDAVTSFGIIIPDSAKEKPEHGIVVAVGPGRRNDKGELSPVGVSVGEKVMFSKYGYDEVKVDGTEYYLVREENILAVFN